MITDLLNVTDAITGTDSAYINCDCMQLLKQLPDDCIDLAIVDPPYGIKVDRHKTNDTIVIVGGKDRPFGGVKGAKASVWGKHKSIAEAKFYHPFDDSSIPDESYFTELQRVSKNQIIWGGNFFLDYLGKATCMIVWDKAKRNLDQADCEIAWTSLPGQSRVFNYKWNGMLQEDMKNKEARIHPTQKPVQLYKWCLEHFAHSGELILDTHVGSASSLIACEQLGFRFIGCELDEYYYEAGLKRFKQETAQVSLFNM